MDKKIHKKKILENLEILKKIILLHWVKLIIKMKKRKDIIKSPEYWFEKTQNEFFRQFYTFMQHNNISQTEIAKKLNVTKGYISQILNGNFNPTLKKLIELSIAINKIPDINFKTFDEVLTSNDQKTKFMGIFLEYLDNSYFLIDNDNMVEIKQNKSKEINKYESNYEVSVDGKFITTLN